MALRPTPKLEDQDFLSGLSPSAKKSQFHGARHSPSSFSFAISDDVMPKGYHLVVRVGFVSRAD